MSARPLVLGALLVVAAGIALVLRASAPQPYSVPALSELLAQPARPGPGAREPLPATLWQGLLAPPFAEGPVASPRLALGQVWAAPTIASLAAERAGELLALAAEGPDGPTGTPLWRALLDGPATWRGETLTLALNGCLHTTDAAAGPILEDTYHARLSLARALQEHAQAAGLALDLRGVEVPVRGGVNFEVQLLGEEHALRVTFDGHPELFLRARRSFRPAAPHTAGARANLVAALRALAGDACPGLVLEGVEQPVAGGVDLRIETVDGRFALLATRGSARLRGSILQGSGAGAQ
ncbi:MAG TPA: hypothetical protein VF530_23255 [Planctomycetota bacterium]